MLSADALAYAKSKIRDIPDFPTPGILFKDITPLLAEPRAFHIVLDSIAERFIGEHVDVIVGVEARGLPARKPGKLPAESDKVSYKTEYSVAQLEMHKESIRSGARVVVVDDVLATGGTAKASAELVRRQGGDVIAYAFVIELAFLKGRAVLESADGPRIEAVLTY